MTLEQAIHERWAACPSLDGLLAADRLKTGRSLGTPVPYATLKRENTQTLCRTNDGRLDQVSLRIDLWHDDYSAGRAVVGEIEAAFDGCSLDLGQGQQLLALRRTDQIERQYEDGLWQFSIRLSARIHISFSEQP